MPRSAPRRLERRGWLVGQQDLEALEVASLAWRHPAERFGGLKPVGFSLENREADLPCLHTTFTQTLQIPRLGTLPPLHPAWHLPDDNTGHPGLAPAIIVAKAQSQPSV
ncbi:hypothetical protein Y1Q_0004011 [Alligator mississippiensis]|uniref:Uncharacterized protein n=1 Tax=Alligator mississippiensis TaxID=8496 RepID=A0A151PHM6_ALLMI|nr:hypothetical protein Y1Q_0004011 [Alligator mississippiensis]